MAVALRRLNRPQAVALYQQNRLAVLVPGLLLALASGLPGINLLVPIVGTAALVHVFNGLMPGQYVERWPA